MPWMVVDRPPLWLFWKILFFARYKSTCYFVWEPWLQPGLWTRRRKRATKMQVISFLALPMICNWGESNILYACSFMPPFIRFACPCHTLDMGSLANGVPPYSTLFWEEFLQLHFFFQYFLETGSHAVWSAFLDNCAHQWHLVVLYVVSPIFEQFFHIYGSLNSGLLLFFDLWRVVYSLLTMIWAKHQVGAHFFLPLPECMGDHLVYWWLRKLRCYLLLM